MHGFEFNKILGALILAVLIASLAGFVAREAIAPENPEKPAYPVDQLQVAQAASAGGAAAAVVAAEPIESLLAAADPAAGQKTSRVCAACHSFDKGGPAKVGPNLWGIVGSLHARAEGFSYSDALKARHDKKWTYEELNQFLFNPKAHIPGTKMAFAGMKNTADRANLIAWLRSLADTPEALPAGK
ncbi:MAG: cytochrome c family protein [Alphaproteobacteria bacterium]